MFDIHLASTGEIVLAGRFDASKVEQAQSVFKSISASGIVDFQHLDYISSAGLSVLLEAQKRLSVTGAKLKLRNLNKQIRDVFHYSGFDRIFEIE